MAAIIGSPTRYIQGKGEMKNLCSYADKFGKNLFILTSASGRKRVEPAINEGNKDSNLVYDVFNGECCMTEINRIIKIVEEAGSDVIIGIGGGKIHDTSKAVAYYTKKPVIIVQRSHLRMHHAVHYLLSIQMKVFLKNICSCHQARIWSW